MEEAGYQGTDSPVQRFVKKDRQAQQGAGDGFMELAWAPGTVQVDFGQADALIDGERETLHVLVVSFPYSNMRFAHASLPADPRPATTRLTALLLFRGYHAKLEEPVYLRGAVEIPGPSSWPLLTRANGDPDFTSCCADVLEANESRLERVLVSR